MLYYFYYTMETHLNYLFLSMLKRELEQPSKLMHTKMKELHNDTEWRHWYGITAVKETITAATEAAAASAAAGAPHIKFSASNVTDCENESTLMCWLLFFFFFSPIAHNVHGGHLHSVCTQCIASSHAFALCMC